MRKQRQLLAVMVLLPLVAFAWASDPAATFEISPVYSNVSFTITKIFFKEDGGFRKYSGKIVYDPNHPERAQVRMVVQADSIDTRNDTRDQVLRSDDFFDVSRYPTLSFVSTSVKPRADGAFDVAGDLTIHGVTKHITIRARFLGQKQMAGWGDFVGFDTDFVIDRGDFGVNGSRWSGGQLILSNDVNVHIAIGATRVGSK
jgi:polyisoprenoid-binding protein YceI